MKIEYTKILFAVLNWGLGHATRSIPLINSLIPRNNEVVIASSGDSLELLKIEFPENIFVELPDYHISYKSSNMVINGIKQFRKVSKAIDNEHDFILRIIEQHNIELVISDNRYGIFHPDIRSILITHQLKLILPKGFAFLQAFVQKKNLKYFSRFDEIWVPDDAGEDNFSGELSHGVNLPVPVKFIGPLSRFTLPELKVEVKYDLVFIISGPEPARSNFEELAKKELMKYQGKAALVLGRMGASKQESVHGFDVFNHLNYKELQQIILSSSLVICRSGYSSIMDLTALNSTAVLIPTPGQTEQEYLAALHHGKGKFVSISQKDFSIEKGMQLLEIGV